MLSLSMGLTKLTRDKILLHSGSQCHWCSEPINEKTFRCSPIVPTSVFTTYAYHNYVASCPACHEVSLKRPDLGHDYDSIRRFILTARNLPLPDVPNLPETLHPNSPLAKVLQTQMQDRSLLDAASKASETAKEAQELLKRVYGVQF